MTTRQAVSPFARPRIEALLAAGFAGTAREFAAAVFKSYGTVHPILNEMHAAGLLRVVGWRRPASGPPLRVYGRADGRRDSPRPPPLGKAKACRVYRRRIKDRFGPEVGPVVLRALDGKASTVVVEGRVIYQRGRGVLVPSIDWQGAA